MDEYQYIRMLAVDRYQGQLNDDGGEQNQEAWEQRIRAEDILFWLKIDSRLRKQGKDYASEHEKQSRFCFY